MKSKVDAAIDLLEEVKMAGLRILLRTYEVTYGGVREVTMYEIIAAGIPPSTFSTNSEKLRELGLIEKVYRDKMYIKLTERGKRLAEAILSLVE